MYLCLFVIKLTTVMMGHRFGVVSQFKILIIATVELYE